MASAPNCSPPAPLPRAGKSQHQVLFFYGGAAGTGTPSAASVSLGGARYKVSATRYKVRATRYKVRGAGRAAASAQRMRSGCAVRTQ
jgi:hypothetical protein